MKLFLVLIPYLLFSCSTLPTVRTLHKTQTAPVPKKIAPQDAKATRSTEVSHELINEKIESPILQNTPIQNIAPVVITTIKQPQETVIKNVSTQMFQTNPKKIGVILPLSGKNATLGQRALTAIRLGLDETKSGLSIAIFDSQGSPDIAAQGVQKLLKDDQVIAILGGLAGKEASSISIKADYYQVPFFAFTQKADLTKNSEYTFRNSITAAMQTSKLVEYAVQKLGLKKFAILYPNDAYGVEFANQFWDHVLAFGGSIVAAQIYNPKEVDLTTSIQKLVGTYYVENRIDEYKNKLDQKYKKQQLTTKKKAARESNYEENKLDPIVDFDALFIPDSSKVMGQALGFLKAADVNQMTFLGTNLWNTDDLIRRAHQGVSQKNNQFYFVDYLVSDEQRKKSEFNSAFSSAFNESPSIIETQTYESAKIIKDLILSGVQDRKSLATSLSSLGHKAGAYSEVYMNNSHEIIRDLTIFHLEDSNIIPLQ